MQSLTVSLAFTSLAMAQTTRFIFNFGDSYSSTTFNPYNTTSPPTTQNPTGNPPYPGETTAGGPNWIDTLTKTLSPSGTLNWNFAYGGATVNRTIAPPYAASVLTFDDQLTEFENSVAGTKKPKPSYAEWTSANSIFIAWFGLNDIQHTAPANFPKDLDDYVAKLAELYAAGARRFLLVYVPPAQRTPQFLAASAAQRSAIASAVTTWNSNVTSHGDAFATAHPAATVKFYDPTDTFNTILDNPTKYGAPNNYCYNSDGTSCLWWNDFHPGQKIQGAVANDIYAVVKAEGFYN